MENVTRSIVKEKAGKAIAVASLGARVALAVVASGAMVVASAYAADAVSSLMAPYAPAAASVAVSWSWLAIALALASATAAMAAFRLNADDGLFARIFLALSVVLPCLIGAVQLCAVGALSFPNAFRDIAAGNASRIADIVLIVALAAIWAKACQLAWRLQGPFIRSFALCALAIFCLPTACVALMGAVVVLTFAATAIIFVVLLPFFLMALFAALSSR